MEEQIKIEMSAQEWNAVLTGLAERPYKEVWIVMNKIRQQAEENLKSKTMPSAPAKQTALVP